MAFPEDFIWGAASAAYQIEGGAAEDGKGPSIWDDFSHTPGKVFGGHTGDVAADAYHRYTEDLDLMKDLGIRHYRFSVSWPRVLPEGRGGINPAGLAYYDRVVDAALERGITPWITLYHWDLPLTLEEEGGWLARDTAYAFGEYSFLIAEHFKDRVRHFFTINEPQCAIGLGYGTGVHAPGKKLSDEELFRAWHHLLLGHGVAARAVRSAAPDALIGLSSTGALGYLTKETCRALAEESKAASLTDSGYLSATPAGLADASFLSLPKKQNGGYFFNHQWFLDPVFLSHYPEDPENPWYEPSKLVPEEDLAVIASPVDLAGLNIYNGTELMPHASSDSGFSAAKRYPGFPRTALKWPVCPEVLYWGPRLIYERYGVPVCITENGQSCNDKIFLDGCVHDPDRIDFLHRYLRELKAASEDGVPVKGYFHWALTDNFEWNSGYDDRFGLIYIDYRTGKRIPKDSAAWYANVIQTNGAVL